MGRTDAGGGSAALDPREVLAGTLKRLKPTRVVAVGLDGKEQEVAVPNRREKWAAVVRALEGIDWAKLKCLDAKGALLDTVVQDDAELDADDVGQLLGGAPKGLDREHGLLVLFCKGQEAATRAQREAMAVLVESYKALTDMFATRLAALEGLQERTIKLAHDAALATATAAASGSTPPEAPEDALMRRVLDGAMGKQSADLEKKMEKAMERVARRVFNMPPSGDAPPTNGTATNGANGKGAG